MTVSELFDLIPEDHDLLLGKSRSINFGYFFEIRNYNTHKKYIIDITKEAMQDKEFLKASIEIIIGEVK